MVQEKIYSYSELTKFIFYNNGNEETLNKIEDYIFNNLDNYDKYEKECLFIQLEVKKEQLNIKA